MLSSTFFQNEEGWGRELGEDDLQTVFLMLETQIMETTTSYASGDGTSSLISIAAAFLQTTILRGKSCLVFNRRIADPKRIHGSYSMSL